MERVKWTDMGQLAPIILQTLEQGGTVTMTPGGRSMEPMLRDRRGQVRLRPVDRPLRRGDIPLYRRESGQWVLHRIIGAEGDTLTLCGDGQWLPERGVRPEQAVGVVDRFTWRGRWVACTDLRYRCYWQVWLLLRPLRHLAHWGAARLKGLARRAMGGNDHEAKH